MHCRQIKRTEICTGKSKASTTHLSKLQILPCGYRVSKWKRKFLAKIRSKVNEYKNEMENFEITIVTAYFDLGTFEKGTSSGNYYTPDFYKTWLSVFALIKNPVICYLDVSSPLTNYFKQLRSKFPKSKTIEINRTDLWSFRLVPQILKIYSRPGYPKHAPNTVVPEYSATMHAKYELMKRSIETNQFRTHYFAWLDVGLFREVVAGKNSTRTDSDTFRLVLPEALRHSTSIAYSELSDLKYNLTSSEIVVDNMVWVGGAYFVGSIDAMWLWSREYMEGVELMMKTNYVSTDQQVIYWLFSNRDHFAVRTEIETFSGTGFNPWFYLGYISQSYNNSDLPT